MGFPLAEPSHTTLVRRLHLLQREHAHGQSEGREEDCGCRRATVEAPAPVESWSGCLIQCQSESVQRGRGRMHLVTPVSLCILLFDTTREREHALRLARLRDNCVEWETRITTDGWEVHRETPAEAARYCIEDKKSPVLRKTHSYRSRQ